MTNNEWRDTEVVELSPEAQAAWDYAVKSKRFERTLGQGMKMDSRDWMRIAFGEAFAAGQIYAQEISRTNPPNTQPKSGEVTLSLKDDECWFLIQMILRSSQYSSVKQGERSRDLLKSIQSQTKGVE